MALKFSSTSLYNELKQFNKLDSKQQQKVLISVKKYWNRSCSRSTPFGLFSASSIVNFTGKSNFYLTNEVE